jgi:hypothetical protein
MPTSIPSLKALNIKRVLFGVERNLRFLPDLVRHGIETN